MSRLELREVVAGFEQGPEVGPVSLSIEEGSMLALLGSSGSGKTTTLRLIAGLHEPLSGDIRFRDQSLLGLPAKKRKVGMVFQNFGLFPHMSVVNNINFGLRMKSTSAKELRERTARMVAAMKLDGLEERFPHQLSGGQQQRVALARTLILDPDILLLDEPLSNLDANLRKETAAFISSLQREFKITTVFVTHDQEEALLLADQVAVIDQGTVLQMASPREICEAPSSLTVAKFMGAENLIHAKGQDEKSFVTALGKIPASQVRGTAVGEVSYLMVRPERLDIRVLTGKLEPQNWAVIGQVVDARYLGGYMTYRVQINEEELTVRTVGNSPIQEGQEVSVSLMSGNFWSIAKI